MSASKPWTFRASVLDSDMSASTKLVLLVVSSYVNDMGDPAWPSYNTIAKKASLSRSSVIAHLNTAIEKGWISKHKRRDKEGLSETNLYRLQTPDMSFQSVETEAPADNIPQAKGGPIAGLPLTGGSANAGLPQSNGCTGVVQPLDPNTSIELSNEQSIKPSGDAIAPPATAEKKAADKKTAKKNEPAPSAEAWEAYRSAYSKRYSVEPLRNAKVNASLKTIVSSVGAEKAPALVAHYLTLSGFYADCQHDIGILVRDLQKVWNTLHKATAPMQYKKPVTTADFHAIDYRRGINADGTF